MKKLSAIDTPLQSGNPHLIQQGRELVARGKVGCLVVAGGEGSRLGFKGPKGAFPITPVRGRTLFEHLADTVNAASKQAGRSLPLAVMTSPKNGEETRRLLEPLLPKDHLFVFEQKTLPFLDANGAPLKTATGSVVEGPDGNGFALRYFVTSGTFDAFQKLGVEILLFILIDNPLADPFDFELAALLQKSDVVIKCTEKKSVDEKVGLIVKENGKIAVVEYSELTLEEKQHTFANLSLFAFSMDFIKRVEKKELPLHKAKKTTEVDGKEVAATKCERFIFDLLPFSKKTEVLAYPRNLVFAPLKNKEGEDSPETVKKLLSEHDKIVFKNISGKSAPEGPFELDPAFFYPTKELLTKWRGKEAPPGYCPS